VHKLAIDLNNINLINNLNNSKELITYNLINNLYDKKNSIESLINILSNKKI